MFKHKIIYWLKTPVCLTLHHDTMPLTSGRLPPSNLWRHGTYFHPDAGRHGPGPAARRAAARLYAQAEAQRGATRGCGRTPGQGGGCWDAGDGAQRRRHGRRRGQGLPQAGKVPPPARPAAPCPVTDRHHSPGTGSSSSSATSAMAAGGRRPPPRPMHRGAGLPEVNTGPATGNGHREQRRAATAGRGGRPQEARPGGRRPRWEASPGGRRWAWRRGCRRSPALPTLRRRKVLLSWRPFVHASPCRGAQTGRSTPGGGSQVLKGGKNHLPRRPLASRTCGRALLSWHRLYLPGN